MVVIVAVVWLVLMLTGLDDNLWAAGRWSVELIDVMFWPMAGLAAFWLCALAVAEGINERLRAEDPPREICQRCWAIGVRLSLGRGAGIFAVCEQCEGERIAPVRDRP